MIYDLIVIGGGPAGYNAAQYAAKKGMSVLLFERKALGGVCLNEGCVPSKAFLYSAKIRAHAAGAAAYGVEAGGTFGIDQRAVVSRKNKIVKRLVAGVRAGLKSSGVEVVEGEARVRRAGETVIVSAGDEEYSCGHLLIATGSKPAVPPIEGIREGLESGFVLTNRGILDLEEIPGRLVVIGAGAVGLEMADYYNAAGSSVTVCEALDGIAAGADRRIADVLRRSLERKGIAFRLSSKVTRITGDSAVISDASGETVLPCDRILVAAGRRADASGMGLEEAGVRLVRGAVETNGRMETNVPGIYAAGDVNGRSMLAHTAFREGEVAVNNMLGLPDEMNYDAVPSVIYTMPEVASAGLTEEAALARGTDARTVSLPMTYSGRYVAESADRTGICILVTDRKKNSLVGAHMVGNHASESIVAASALIGLETDLDRIKKVIFPHPTEAEVMRECLFEL